MIKFFMKKSLLVILSLFIFSLFFYMVRGEKGSRPDLRQKGESFIEGLRIVHKKNGSNSWVLTAKRADISENGDKARLTDLEMKIEHKGMKVQAASGLYSMSDRNLTIDGMVVASNGDFEITSENVTFDSGAGILKTDGSVRVEGKKFSLDGSGMDIDNASQKVRILRNVKAVFHN